MGILDIPRVQLERLECDKSRLPIISYNIGPVSGSVRCSIRAANSNIELKIVDRMEIEKVHVESR
jgi:hypothetical protein